MDDDKQDQFHPEQIKNEPNIIENSSYASINFIELLFFFSFSELSLIYQNLFPKPFFAFVQDSIFTSISIFVFASSRSFFRPIAFFLFCYNIIETITWGIIGDGINFQVISNLHIDSQTFSFFIFCLIIIIIVVLLYIYCFECVPCNYNFPYTILLILFFVNSYILCLCAQQKYLVLYPFEVFSHTEILEGTNPKLLKFFSDYKQTVSFRSSQRKNILIINFESFELYALGKFNQLCRSSMPYFSSLTNTATYCNNATMVPYTHFTAASFFASECGLPLLVKQAYGKDRDETIHLHIGSRCIGDIFNKLGYKLEFHAGDSCGYSDLGLFLKQHHYTLYNDKYHVADENTFNYVKKTLFPKLNQTNQPYLVVIETRNTHFTDNIVDKSCKIRTFGCHRKFRGYDCDDQLIEQFLKDFEKAGLQKTTEVLIYGDHQSHLSYGIFGNHRNLGVFLPFHPKKVITKHVSMYDIGPTILDLAGIDYKEGFPFGESILSDRIPDSPNQADYELIYKIFSKKLKLHWNNIQCEKNVSGFCLHDIING